MCVTRPPTSWGLIPHLRSAIMATVISTACYKHSKGTISYPLEGNHLARDTFFYIVGYRAATVRTRRRAWMPPPIRGSLKTLSADVCPLSWRYIKLLRKIYLLMDFAL